MVSLLPKNTFEFSKAEYWEAFFKHRGNKTFEWYGEYPELCGYLHKYMKAKDKILVTGCGNSKISEDLYDVGYRQITNIDISKVAIRQMKANNDSKRPEMIFEEMDVTKMSYMPESFTVVFDKGTFDALMPDEENSTVDNVKKYLEEIDRVLRIGGRFIVITLLQQFIMNFLLDHFYEKGWMIRICRCHEVEARSLKEQGYKGLPVFMVVFTKFKKMGSSSPVCELCLAHGGPAIRVNGIEKMKECVLEAQEVAIVCSGLQRSNAGGKEIELEVAKPNDTTPRYAIRIVEKPTSKTSGLLYAAFIVPQGRETEWAFGTPEGRQFLLTEAEVDRLAVILLNRGHTFTTLEQIKDELDEVVRDFAPSDFKKNIPYLSLGGDVGIRNEVCTGESSFSGEYIVEDIQGENGNLFRRLYFLSSKSSIQSEAKVRKIKTSKGAERVVVDNSWLSCTHHGYMTIGISSVLQNSGVGKVLVIGLGGGALCSYVKKVFPKCTITAVEIDPEILSIAVDFFGLEQDKQLLVYIRDGLVFMSEAQKRGEKYDVLIFDVDNKDVITGLISPPQAFLENQVLQLAKNLLSPTGLFILNLVCRKKCIRDDLYKRLKNLFGTVKALKLEDDLNELFYCWRKPKIDAATILSKGYTRLNNIINQKKYDALSCVEPKNLFKPD